VAAVGVGLKKESIRIVDKDYLDFVTY